jgi:hypothetical protein
MSANLERETFHPFEQFIPSYSSQFRIGGVSVRLTGACATNVALTPSLEAFRVEAASCQIDVQVEWVSQLLGSTRPALFDSGSVWSLYEEENGFRFDFSTPAMGPHPYKRLMVDDKFRQARLLLNEEYFATVAAAPLGYPLDEVLILHRLTQEKAVEMHGCGIVTQKGIGNLFVGHSGAGKSTTTRLWTSCQDAEILSDDRIIVRRSPDQDSCGEIRMYGTPWHGEADYASPASASLKRILILEHGYGNILTRLSKSQAVGELFARSFVPFHRHEYLDTALSFLHELVDAVPCYRYSFEPDQRAVDAILSLHD